MQRVHSRARRELPPEVRIRTLCKLGRNVLGLTLWAWEMFLPKTVFLPQLSQTRAIAHHPPPEVR